MIDLIGDLVREYRLGRTEKVEALRTKGTNPRDVVTRLDMALHNVASEYVKLLHETTLLSEESEDLEESHPPRFTGNLLVFDPLDGSNNFRLGLPSVACMGVLMKDSYLEEAFVIQFSESRYVHWRSNDNVAGNPLPAKGKDGAPYYLAYAPVESLGEAGKILVPEMHMALSTYGSGVYRDGSAGAAIYRCTEGQYMGMVCVQVRIWDGLAALPILWSRGFRVAYKVEGLSISLVASSNYADFDNLLELFAKVGNPLSIFLPSEKLKI